MKERKKERNKRKISKKKERSWCKKNHERMNDE